jgi:hypothetical protein
MLVFSALASIFITLYMVYFFFHHPEFNGFEIFGCFVAFLAAIIFYGYQFIVLLILFEKYKGDSKKSVQNGHA